MCVIGFSAYHWLMWGCHEPCEENASFRTDCSKGSILCPGTHYIRGAGRSEGLPSQIYRMKEGIFVSLLLRDAGLEGSSAFNR
jgi:hypothetical protein